MAQTSNDRFLRHGVIFRILTLLFLFLKATCEILFGKSLNVRLCLQRDKLLNYFALEILLIIRD